MNGMDLTRRPSGKMDRGLRCLDDRVRSGVVRNAVRPCAGIRPAHEEAQPGEGHRGLLVAALATTPANAEENRPSCSVHRDTHGKQAKAVSLGWRPAVCPDHQLIVIARDDDTTFGILHSRFHEAWALRLGTSLEDRSPLHANHHLRHLPVPAGPVPRHSGGELCERRPCNSHCQGSPAPSGAPGPRAQSS